MTSPSISIIVPVYKVETYIRRCLDSIVAQTFTDWECILIDDGSPDNSGKICDEYADNDKRFRVLHQMNAGVSAARNVGLEIAYGKWITFVDSDDWVEPEMLTDLYNYSEKNNADVVVSGFYMTDGKRKTKEFQVKNGILNMPKDFEWYIQGPCAKLFSRTILHNYNIRFPLGITLAEDLWFTFQVYFHSSAIYGFDKVLYGYFQNPKSTMHIITHKMIQDEVKVVVMMENKLKENCCATDNWIDFINVHKVHAKDRFLFSLREPDIYLWRNTFMDIIYHYSDKWQKTLFKKILQKKLDTLCKLLLRLRFKIKNIHI